MIQIIVFVCLLLVLTKPMGLYLAFVFDGRAKWLSAIEKPTYRILGIDKSHEQDWKEYASSVLLFSGFTFLVTYLLLRFQGSLPLNPQGYGSAQMPEHLALNTSLSFLTNTNWQSYVPETTLSTFSNMANLAVHNWMSAAAGLAVAVALVRGLSRKSGLTLGSFWVDMVRSILYAFLPLCLVGALVYVWAGVPQTLTGAVTASTLEGGSQKIALGPVASQEIIKQLGSNGGGFFNANSAHPFENPTPFADIFTKLLILVIPAGLTYMFGKMVGNVRQGWAIFAAMAILFLVGAFIGQRAELTGNPAFAQFGVETANMEGKETRFGIDGSTLFASVTTAASCGAVNAMHDSFTPIGGLVPLFNILTGEVIFGGVGSGLYGMLTFVLLSVFISGLMVGRTPEYLGKRIGRFEVQMAMISILSMAALVLFSSAFASVVAFAKENSINTFAGSAYGGSDTPYGPMTGNLNNPGAHGFSEILYTFASATGNNGSAFAGITANTPIYNFLIGFAMLIGRFLVILPVLAIAGNMVRKKTVPASAGTFPTDSITFALLLAGIVVVVGALTFFPAMALGPIVEHLQMTGGIQK